MREIKFRAWDKIEGKMWIPIIDEDGIPCVKHPITCQLIRMDGDLLDPVMQYTGLKDKNGKEIYEGDILSGEWGEQQTDKLKEKITAPVVFNGGCFVIDWWMKKHKLENADIGIRWRDYYHAFGKDCYYEITPLEIIGNIYENPELLK